MHPTDTLLSLSHARIDGTLAHEMTGDANEAFRTELWNREQRERAKFWGEPQSPLRAVS